MDTRRRLPQYSIRSLDLVVSVWEMSSTICLERMVIHSFRRSPRVVLSAALEMAVLSRKRLHLPDFPMGKKSPPKSELVLTFSINDNHHPFDQFEFSAIDFFFIHHVLCYLFTELSTETKRLFCDMRTTF